MGSEPSPKLTHLDERGHVRMVDVGAKEVTPREASASARVRIGAEAFELVQDGTLPKGDVLAVARVAGIQAAKRTAELIPLCHPLPITSVDIELTLESPETVRVVSAVRVTARTGVEMEALTAASVAALTVYDMCKSVTKDIEIGPVRLEHKSGGKSGDYARNDS